MTSDRRPRVFLLLQGPHGPFFDRLGALLEAAGAPAWRVAFNAGDAFFWSRPDRLVAHTGPAEAWPGHLATLIAGKGVTDLVFYGDTRPLHAAAVEAARARGLTLHVFEEGYLRPWWITYERGGSNGHSRLMTVTDDQIRAALRRAPRSELRRPPAHWGDMRQHKFYGALYHLLILTRNRRFAGWRSHRAIPVAAEARLNFARWLRTPLDAARGRIAQARIRGSGHPYVVVLLQLAHDASFRAHSDHPTLGHFLAEVVAAFAEGAPRHHHLVFKAHPLEDGREPLAPQIAALAQAHGVAGRVHLVHGGKLAPLLAQARAAVTVNSTAAQQALWRGLPVKATGRAVYARPGLVSGQALADFFAAPERPDPDLYRDFRDYLLETSQLAGGFYAARGRADALRLAVDLMLAPLDPYDALESGGGAYRQQPGHDR